MSPPSFPTQLAFSPWRGAVPTVPTVPGAVPGAVPGVVPMVAAASPVAISPTSVAQEMGLWEPLEPWTHCALKLKPRGVPKDPTTEEAMKNQAASPRMP